MRIFLQERFSCEGGPKTLYLSAHWEGRTSSGGAKFNHGEVGKLPYASYCFRLVLHSKMVILLVDNLSHFLF